MARCRQCGLKGTAARRHLLGMTSFLTICLLLAAPANAVAQERAIDNAIAALNDPQQRMTLFASGADAKAELARLDGIHTSRFPGMLGVDEAWPELTTPRIVPGRIRRLTRTTAEVDGESRIEGAVTVRKSVPLRFVLRREEGRWRIVSIRVMAEQ
jgi:hypothetical protein